MGAFKDWFAEAFFGEHSGIIITATVVLTVIVVFTIVVNEFILRFITRFLENKLLKFEGPGFYSDLSRLKNAYQEEQKKQDHPINIQSFVEGYYAKMNFKFVFREMNVVKWIDNCRQMSSVCIMIGVLFTFIGLSLSLVEMNHSELSKTTLEGFLSRASIGFISSIFGLLSSLLITFVVKIFRNSENLLMNLMIRSEQLLETIRRDKKEDERTELMRQSNEALQQMAGLFSNLESFADSIEQSSKNMKNFNTGFKKSSDGIAQLFEEMHKFTHGFSSHIENLNGNFNQLTSYMQHAEQDRNAATRAIAELYPAVMQGLQRHAQAQAVQKQALEADVKMLYEHHQAFQMLVQSTDAMLKDSSQRTFQINTATQELLGPLYGLIQQASQTFNPEQMQMLQTANASLFHGLNTLKDQLPAILDTQNRYLHEQRQTVAHIVAGSEHQGKITEALHNTASTLGERTAGNNAFIQQTVQHLEQVMKHLSEQIDAQAEQNADKTLHQLENFVKRATALLDHRLGALNQAAENLGIGVAAQLSTAVDELNEHLPEHLNQLTEAIQEQTRLIRNPA